MRLPWANFLQAFGLKSRRVKRAVSIFSHSNLVDSSRLAFPQGNSHDPVQAPKPTGSELSKTEVPSGPLLFQGDHGLWLFGISMLRQGDGTSPSRVVQFSFDLLP